MKNVYSCPHCKAVLNPSTKILLLLKCRRKKGLILFSPQPGNFQYFYEKDLEDCLKHGAVVTFQCPVCTGDLTSPHNGKFAHLNLTTPGQKHKRVEFCRVFGKHATFVISEFDVIAFGEDAEVVGRTNFFGV